jgi:hypothetical protein
VTTIDEVVDIGSYSFNSTRIKTDAQTVHAVIGRFRKTGFVKM